MSMLEDRVRAALSAHAEEFSAHPDAWARIRARSLAARRRRGGPRWLRPSRFLIPAAAAATVVAIVVGVAAVVHGVTGRVAATPAGSAVSPSPSPGLSLLARGNLLKADPPVSAIVALRLPATSKPAVDYFWMARNSPAYWPDQIDTQLQLCHLTFSLPHGGGEASCWPLAGVTGGQLAVVTDNMNYRLGNGQQIAVGAATGQVSSVAAVLPGGRAFPGTIGTGRGFPYQAWAVGYPPASGVRLVFRDAAGREIASLSPAAPDHPRQIPQPRSGGVTVFRYAAGDHTPSGTMLGYLVDGRVGFWSRLWGGEISQVPAAGGPALGGLLNPFRLIRGGAWGTVEAFGYAHADVTRVVLHLTGGGEVTATTFPAGWAGSDLRLWAVPLPSSIQIGNDAMPSVTATAFGAAGHLLGRVQLGGME